MPTGIDGQWNIAGLQVPGVYIDIIPPSPNLNGAPTNVVGMVGVGSWGPPNAIITASKPNDCAVSLGVPQIRNHDIATHVWAASQVGGAAAYNLVRVTDGTDTAATGTIQTTCLTLTAKYTGTLGNAITYSAAAGTQAGTYSFTIGFPGAASEIFNNIGQGISSVATVAGTTYTSVPSASTTAAPAGAGNVNAVVSPTLSVYGAPTVVGGGTSGFVVNDLLYLPYGIVLKVATVSTGAVATVTLQGAGLLTGGAIPANPVSMVSTSGAGVGTPTFTLTWGLGAPTIVPGVGYVTAPTIILTGGGGAGGSYTASLGVWLNLANAINNGTAYRGASHYVVATAGAGLTAPTLGVTTTLSGGTDGAAGVTDTTLVGSDTTPRKGMYALRNSGTDSFTLVDLNTSSLWPTIDSFAVSESCVAVLATASGDTPAGAIASRTAVGLDDFTTWLIAGDWPTFYDSQNAVSRLVCPTAFGLGLVGNLSPEQSPLNKVLRGISATQKSQAGQTYSNADLQVAEMGGVDLIVGPPTTWGGNYFTFATGRNAWSNTGGNGVEFSRLTMFIARSLQLTVVGSIIGQLQSTQPNDQMRANAKALLDGFFAQLADPTSGTNGHGMIDQWATQCDLTNNPPALQARGYLFAYCTVRYLNVIRYFVIKLAGGGNVTVTTQSTPPSPSQFS